MSDTLTIAQRHRCMSNIKNKDTKPEIWVRKFLFSHGFRYRLNKKDLPGKPDIVLSKYKTVIFINGCFWHGHENCKYSKLPETNHIFWLNKINRNINRDKLVRANLTEMGWNIIDIWQCQLKPKVKESTLNNLILNIRNEQK